VIAGWADGLQTQELHHDEARRRALRSIGPIKFPTLCLLIQRIRASWDPGHASAAVPGGDRAAPVFENAVRRSYQS
jgi:hypothetical protein